MSSIENAEPYNVEIETSYQDNIDLRSIVDKEVQTMLYPLNVMQILVLNPKYCIKNSSIKPNNIFNKFFLIFGLVILLASYMKRHIEISIDDNIQRYNEIKFLYFASIFDFAYYSAGFIMNVILHWVHSNKIITFIMTFQEVHRFLNNEASFKWSVIRNWINVCLIFGFYFITWLFVTFVNNHPPWYVVLNLIFLICLDTNLVYVISLIELLADKVKLWNVRVLQSTKYEQGEDEMDCEQMSEAYVQILKCYEICKNIFQKPVLYQTVETFCRCLINVQVMIEFRKPFFVTTPLLSVFLYFWVIKTLFFQLWLSLQVEAFYQAVKHAQDSCSSILASNCTDEQKKLCKNILRVHNASYSKMSACGLFYVDICQPIRLMALLTNYTVVLLQFAFL